MSYRARRAETSRAKFLTELARNGNVSETCLISGVPRATVYDWRAADPGFASAWDEAIQQGTECLEDECRRRAMSGSDALMVFMLRALKPDVYKRPTTIDIHDRREFDYRAMARAELHDALRELRAAQQNDPPATQAAEVA